MTETPQAAPGDPAGALMDGLVDDAGLFPPTALDMADAVARHREDVAVAHPMLTQRFLCPASRVGELRGHLRPGDRFRVGLIADGGADGLQATVDEIAGDDRLELALVEFPLRATGQTEPAAAARAAALAVDATGVPEGVPLYLEPVRLAEAAALADAVAARPGTSAGRTVGVKFRCGGVSAELFPEPEELAGALLAAVGHGVPVKATAGLHHAVRHTDQGTGFVHHGYLNLVLATADAVAGTAVDGVADTLRGSDADTLAVRARSLDAATVAATRRVLRSYGSCDTRVPVAEAAELGLMRQRDERERLSAT
ncbi:hypothetical protein [Haloechinothrix sp. LS1_15]|uniref:hypothetical protein n=1 Tax=Haloechinothrix sp. LS1_15 TaxID=2652248 RepID=UPI0029472755|nr:hypothetical protein [Haloechinothrix sp. LS1_15]MDV6013659.1 hypothetical protein [Haloechinothrix sp. LS1_15]